MIDEIVTEPEIQIQEYMEKFREMLDEGDFSEADNYRRRIFLHDNYHALRQNPDLMQDFLDYSIEYFETRPVEEDNPIMIKLTNFFIRYQIRELNKMKKRYSQ